MKVLANDGLHQSGISKLEAAGITVITEKIEQEDLATGLQEFDGILVRSATKVRKELIDACPNLRFIGRGGVGMDNIDVEYARSKGIVVNNTPAASSQSVAELALGNMFGMVRYLYQANRNMPGADSDQFKKLKKAYGKGSELKGKTLGIIGYGRIGEALAVMALGIGMRVVFNRRTPSDRHIDVRIVGAENPVRVTLPWKSLEEIYAESDFISLHVPGGGEPLINAAAFSQMKEGVCIVNAARGGVLDETALLAALESGKVAHAALDVFDGEPNCNEAITKHPQIALTPHIGAATVEAQSRIGEEMADRVIAALKG